MLRGTGLWKAILFAVFAAVLAHDTPASAVLTVDAETSVTFAWDPASGNVAGYYVFVFPVGESSRYYSTVIGRNWETVTANASETITVRVVAFDAEGSFGEPSAPSEAVLFSAEGEQGAPPAAVSGQAADFDQDGISDLIVQSSTKGYLELTSMGGGNSTLLVKCRDRSNATTQCTPVKMAGNRWMIVGNGDYDGDGTADLLFRRHRNGVQQYGTIMAFLMDGDRIREIVKLSMEQCTQRSNGEPRCRFVPTRAKKEWQIVGSGDYNGDGRSDVLVHNVLLNQFDLWSMAGGGIHTSEILPDDFGDAAEVIASGDFDGDGMSDILWRDLASGDVDIWGLTQDSTLGALEGGADPWSAIGAGDFDADGRDDVLLREENTDRLAVRLSTRGVRDAIVSALNEGARDRQIPAIGDYNGDGFSDLVVHDGDLGQTELWLMQGFTVAASEALSSPLETWDFASVDLRPPGSR